MANRKFSEPINLSNDSSPVSGFSTPIVRKRANINTNVSTPLVVVSIEKLDVFNQFITGCNFPGISLGSTLRDTPYAQIKKPGDSFNYEPLSIDFNVSEDWENVMEIQRWMRAIGPASNHDENRVLNDDEVSDATLSITTNASIDKMVARVRFKGIFPISFQGFQLSSNERPVENLVGNVNFDYTEYTIDIMPEGTQYIFDE